MLGRYFLTFLLTLTIEGVVAYLLGFRKREYLLALIVANVITHPALNYVLVVLRYVGIDATLMLIILLEILVVIAEWQVLVYIFGNSKWRFFIASLLANAVSFLVGLLLF